MPVLGMPMPPGVLVVVVRPPPLATPWTPAVGVDVGGGVGAGVLWAGPVVSTLKALAWPAPRVKGRQMSPEASGMPP